MRRFLFVCVFLTSLFSYSQIIVSPDTTICGNYQDTLVALSSNPSSMSSDDQHDVVVDIGFTFNFYGIPYTQLVVSGNGYVTFDISQASQYSPWAINAPIPNPGNLPENAIMAPWQDINTGIGGNIYYGVSGIAPNRVFIVTWCEVPMFSCTSDLHTSQIILYEGSDKIEMFLQEKPLCITWNVGAGIQGLVDATSTNFDIVNDPTLLLPRNFPLPWTATNEGWEFNPNNPATSYTINQIPYVPIIAGLNTWTDVAGTVLGTGPTLPVNISSSATYYANITGNCTFGNLTDSITMTVPECFDINLISTDASCLGNDGEIICTPDTLLPIWQCELYDLAGNNLVTVTNIIDSSYTFTNLFPGTYVVQAISGISSAVDTIIVDQVQNPISIISNVSSVSCYNGNNGQISVLATGGLLPYQYFINGVLNTNAYPYDSLFLDLSGGYYIISVMDANNCMNRDTVIVSSPQYTLQALAASKVIICTGSSDGFCVGSAAGGSPGYSYEWFDIGMNSFSTNDTAFNLSAGSYYLEVMDANGCDTFATVDVIAPQVPLSGSPQVFNVVCNGDSSGMIVGDASGSWSPYQYEWFDQNNDLLQTSSGWPAYIFTRDTLKNITAGLYFLKVTDAQGCIVEYTLNVDEPLVALSIDSMNVISPIACYGDSVGIARLYVSGGDPVYSYLWDNGETGIIASSLTSGYHSVSLTDDWGCEVMDSIFMPENSLIESALLADTTVSCYGLSDGVASISSFGGSSITYTYFWSTGQQTVGVNNDVATGLQQGSYYVTTRDALGCEVVDSIYISEPDPLSMEALELDWIDCYGYDNGLAFAQAFGGTAPYTFSWDNGQWSGDTVSTLTPGLHTVVVTDARGCTASDTVETHEPTALHVEIDHSLTVLPYCVGVNTASLTGVASGGTLGYTYAWDDNPVQPQTTATAVALLADNLYSLDNSYTITVTDSKGCTASATTDTLQTFNETMNASVASLSNYVGGYGVSCYGALDGQALVTAQGAHAPYSYQWYGPSGYVGVNDTISNLQAGVYSVTVKDTNDCMVNSSIIITEPAGIFYTVLSVLNDETCLGACDGSIKVDISGGFSPYVSIATDMITGNMITSSMGISNDSLVTGICSGTYDLVFSDENGCSSTLLNGGVGQATIITNNMTVAEIDDFSTVDVLCNGSSTGVLYASNVNTDPGFTYSWQDLNGNIVSTSSVASNLSTGTYVLYADYNNTMGCTVTDTAVVSELPIINPSASITDVDCYGNSSGVLIASAVGGTSPYNWLWNTGMSGSIVNNLPAGTYILTVTDANNCQVIDTFEVNEPDALVSSITQNGYVLTVSGPNGGTLPYSYAWYEQSSPFSSLGGGLNYVVSSYGTYYVEVTDANGCEVISNSVSYDEGPLGTIDISSLDIQVYPNPFRDEVTIDFGRVILEGKINLVDVYGKLVETYELSSTDKYVIERTNKSSGIYFIELDIEGEYLQNIKLIIE